MLCSYRKKLIILPPEKWNICKHVFSKLQTLGVAVGGPQFKGLKSTKEKKKIYIYICLLKNSSFPHVPRLNLLFLSLNGPNTHPVAKLKKLGNYDLIFHLSHPHPHDWLSNINSNR